ncbi:MAG: cell division inhibitor SepF [Frankiaceae bacterium]|jgi:cell division inhibitor SepF|nr:cell division inhibitor SepF [Frankiaceae bacterium]
MAGVLRKTMVYLGLVEQADDEYDDVFEDDLEPTGQVRRLAADEPVPVRRYPAPESRGALAVDTDRRTRPVETRLDEGPAYRITTFVPAKYNDAKEIGEHFRQSVPVIMNLTEMDDDSAKRLVDFAAGLTFGLRGSLEKVTNKVFLLSPSNVTVSAEDKARIREGGFFNQS